MARAVVYLVRHAETTWNAEGRLMHHGDWEGRLVEELAATDGERLRMWRDSPAEVRVPGGESMADVRMRAMRAFNALVTRHRHEAIVVVAHGGVNRAILLALQGAPLGNYRQIRQDNGCVNIIEVDEERSRVLTLNDTRHLGADD